MTDSVIVEIKIEIEIEIEIFVAFSLLFSAAMPSAIELPLVTKSGFSISIDRGGTFTDCIATNIPGKEDIVIKLLSVDPSNYDDAPTAGLQERI